MQANNPSNLQANPFKPSLPNLRRRILSGEIIPLQELQAAVLYQQSIRQDNTSKPGKVSKPENFSSSITDNSFFDNSDLD